MQSHEESRMYKDLLSSSNRKNKQEDLKLFFVRTARFPSEMEHHRRLRGLGRAFLPRRHRMTNKHVKRCSLYLPTHTHTQTEVAKSGRCPLEKFGEEKTAVGSFNGEMSRQAVLGSGQCLGAGPTGRARRWSPSHITGRAGRESKLQRRGGALSNTDLLPTASWTVGAPGNAGASRTSGWGARGGGDERPRGPWPQPLSSAHLWCAQLRL